MSFAAFIPTVWSAYLLEELRKNLVFAQLFNRNYEGEITDYGNRVAILATGNVTVKTYTGAAIDDPEDVTGSARYLDINQAEYFNFQVKDIDRAQYVPDMMAANMRSAAYKMSEKVDTYLASILSASATTGITITVPDTSGTKTETKKSIAVGSAASPVSVTASTAYNTLVDIYTKMSENNIPKAGRWIVIPPWFAGMLAKDTRFTGGYTESTAEAAKNGLIGDNIAGFRVYESNNLPVSSGKYTIIAGTMDAGTMADQVTETIPYKPENNFSDAVKGLLVYGASVVNPDQVVVLTAQDGTT